MSNLKNEIDQALRVRDSQQTAAREARKHAGGMWLGAGQERAKDEEACRCGGVSAWGGDVRMDAGGRAGRARRRYRRELRQALRGVLAEGENRTEYAVVLIRLSFSIFTIGNRNKDNCIFGSVFTSNVVLELEPKVSNYRNVALVEASGRSVGV